MPGRLRDPGPFLKTSRLDEALRAAGAEQGWTVAELRRRAAEVGIVGRSTMRKDALLSALRAHAERDGRPEGAREPHRAEPHRAVAESKQRRSEPEPPRDGGERLR